MNMEKLFEEYLPTDAEINEETSREKKFKKTWNKDHPGLNWQKDVSKSVERMKKHPKKIDNPWALRQWQLLPKFKKEREAAAKKAAEARE